jgi:hypothetical protein
LKYVVMVALIVAGVIHLLPLPGVLGADRLTSLYGLSFNDSNLVILMRHRAVLFGLVGAFLIIAAFVPGLQLAAFTGGFVSVASFFWLAWSAGSYNAAIGRVVTADIVAFVSLVIGAAAATWLRTRG